MSANLTKLEQHLATRSYVEGYVFYARLLEDLELMLIAHVVILHRRQTSLYSRPSLQRLILLRTPM